MQSRCRGQQPLLRVWGTASVSAQDILSGPWSRAPAAPALACFNGQFKKPVQSTRLHGVFTCLLPLRHLEPKLRSLQLALVYSHQRTPALLGVGFLDLQGEDRSLSEQRKPIELIIIIIILLFYSFFFFFSFFFFLEDSSQIHMAICKTLTMSKHPSPCLGDIGIQYFGDNGGLDFRDFCNCSLF